MFLLLLNILFTFQLIALYFALQNRLAVVKPLRRSEEL